MQRSSDRFQYANFSVDENFVEAELVQLVLIVQLVALVIFLVPLTNNSRFIFTAEAYELIVAALISEDMLEATLRVVVEMTENDVKITAPIYASIAR